MKLDLANQRMLLVVWLLAFKTLLALCVGLTACIRLLAIEPLVAESVCAKLNLTRTGMDLLIIKKIQLIQNQTYNGAC